MNVILSDEAMNDLVCIGEFIKRDNPGRAATFVDELDDRCRRLGEMPHGHPLLRSHEKTGIRRRRHGNYLIFFIVAANEVQILRILHGARDYEAILFASE